MRRKRYKVIEMPDGKFRIQEPNGYLLFAKYVNIGCDGMDTGRPLEFDSKEKAQKWIERKLSFWRIGRMEWW